MGAVLLRDRHSFLCMRINLRISRQFKLTIYNKRVIIDMLYKGERIPVAVKPARWKKNVHIGKKYIRILKSARLRCLELKKR